MSHRIGILCAGRKGKPSWEDTLCAGAMVAHLQILDKNAYLTDSAKIALALWQTHGTNIRLSEHAEYLSQIGYDIDIEFSAIRDVSTAIPKMFDGRWGQVLRDISGELPPYPRRIDPFEELLRYMRK